MSSRAYSRAGIARRLFNTPLAVLPDTAAIVLGAIGADFNVGQLVVGMGEALSIEQLQGKAADALAEIRAKAPIDQTLRQHWGNVAASDVMPVLENVAHINVRGETVSENGLNPESGFTGYDGIRAKAAIAANDADVRGILLDINSPGGEVAELFELCEFLMSIRGKKPMRAIIRSTGASAAYAIAACCDTITVAPESIAGSIGVLTMHADLSGRLKKEGVVVTLIHAGARKVDGNPLEPLADDVRAKLQAWVDETYGRFVAHVAQARRLDEGAVRAQEAATFRGQEAVDAGLADKVMGWADSQAEFASLVNGRQPPALPQRPTGQATVARSTQERTMATAATTAPAAETQPENEEEATTTATTETETEEEETPGGTSATTTEEEQQEQATAQAQAQVTGERARVLALIDLCPESNVSATLLAAIESGQDQGAFAIELAKGAKARGGNLEQLRAGAVQKTEVPKASTTQASTQPKNEAERGRGVVALAASLGHAAAKHLAPKS